MTYKTSADALKDGYALRVYGIDDHLWHFNIGTERDAVVPAWSVQLVDVFIQQNLKAARLADL